MYSAASTCPVIINKLNGVYYVTNTLAHLRGFSEILEIRSPESLTIYKLPKPRRKKGKVTTRYVGDDETKSRKGAIPLVDSIGVLTLATFSYHEQLYHIVTDFSKTFLMKIINGRFVSVDTVSNESLWTYDPEVFVASDKHSIVFFDNQQAAGYLDIFEDRIRVVRSK